MDIKKLLITICLPIAFWACDTNTGQPLDLASMVQYIPVQTAADGRWGMMSTDGILMFENEFTDLPTMAVNGLFSVAEGQGYSLYAVADQPRLVGECEDMAQIGYCNDRLIPVSRTGERITVVGCDGLVRFVLMPVGDKEIVGCSNIFSDSRLVVTDADGLYGCVDTNGEVVIAPKYASMCDFSNGYSIATHADGTYTIVNRKGDAVCDIKAGYRVVSTEVKHDDFIVSDSIGNLSFVSIDGNMTRLPAKVKAVGEYTDDVFTFQAENELWGLMSRTDNMMLMRPKFGYVKILDAGNRYLVDLDGTWSIINIKGKKVIDFADSYTSVIASGFSGKVKYMAKDNAGWVLLDDEGKEIHTDFSIYNIGYDTTAAAGGIGASYEAAPKVSFVEEVVKQITPNSLCGIQLNAIANRWYKEQSPDSLVDTKEFIPDSIPEIKRLGDVSVIGVTDRLISAAMRFNVDTRRVEYAFIPSNTVGAIELDIVTKNPEMYTKSKTELVQALVGMGYELIEDVDDLLLLRSHYANLEISLDEDNTITILMYRL